jgi:mono/diheme cytochrome c family protein
LTSNWVAFISAAQLATVVLFGCSGTYSTSGIEHSGDSSGKIDKGSEDKGKTNSNQVRNASPDSETLNLTDKLPKSNLKTYTVKISPDAVYVNETKTFLAYKLSEVLALLPKFKEAIGEMRRSSWGITFEALDRFKVTFPVSKIYEKEAYLAYKEAARTDGKDWALIPAKREAMTPAPFYLVWKDLAPTLDFPNPYQVAFITLEPLSVTYKDAYPSQEKLVPGFAVFSSRCIWCHSINYVGGRSALEFNVPKSIVEGKNVEDLPYMMQGQRNTTGKPCKLSPENNQTTLTQLWNYLSERAQNQICKTAEDCEKKEPL